jgi:hypothetical protein
MASTELENLLRIGKLKAEPPAAAELRGLLRSGRTRLRDSEREELGIESRFDLAYNAAHALALAALRRLGYRSENRYIVFQSLTLTLGLPTATWRVLAKGHELRNQVEYKGVANIDDLLVEDLIAATRNLLAALESALGDAFLDRES